METIGSAPIAEPARVLHPPSSSLPADAFAIVEPLPPGVQHGGRALRGQWRVRFPPRYAPRVDPLTGWLGSGDPLATLELRFPDHASAIRYCERQQLPFALHHQ